MDNATDLGIERLLPEPVVRDLTSLSRGTRWAMIRQGQFPQAVRLSAGRVAWTESSIRRWISEKIGVAA